MFGVFRKLRKDEREAPGIKFILLAVLITVSAVVIMGVLGTSLKELFFMLSPP